MEAQRALETLCWLVIGMTTALVVVAGLVMGFSVAGSGVVRPLTAIGVLTSIGWIYRHRRPDVRIATAMTGVAQLVAFSSVGAALSYILAAGNRPLWDATFMAWDQALSLDWRAYLAVINARPTLGWWLGVAYLSIMPQLIVAVAALALTGRVVACQTFVATFLVCAFFVILVSGAMPALSIIPHLGFGPQDYSNLNPAAAYGHVSDVLSLRDGTLRTLHIDRLEGIIAFPSLHAGLAVILAGALWSIPWLRWPGLVSNTAMLAATPIHGSHYFVDVFAGLAAAGASYLFVRRVGRSARPDVMLARRDGFAATSS